MNHEAVDLHDESPSEMEEVITMTEQEIEQVAGGLEYVSCW